MGCLYIFIAKHDVQPLKVVKYNITTTKYSTYKEYPLYKVKFSSSFKQVQGSYGHLQTASPKVMHISNIKAIQNTTLSS